MSSMVPACHALSDRIFSIELTALPPRVPLHQHHRRMLSARHGIESSVRSIEPRNCMN